MPDADLVATALGEAGVDLFMPTETKLYHVGEAITAVRQFLVTDPDGYLFRFLSVTSDRTVTAFEHRV